MSQSAGTAAYALSFEYSPIILTGGIAQFLGGMLPIIAITDAISFGAGLLGGSSSVAQPFAHFQPLPGGTLIDNQYGKYPFANQSVAANAVIAQPLHISMLMTCPASASGGGVAAKLATITALQAAISTHVNSGGTFIVATPSYIYTNCVLNSLTDATPTNPQQPQSQWVWAFEQPLLTLSQAQQTYNGMMAKLAGGLPSTGATSGVEVIASPQSLAASAMFPSASNLAGTSTAGASSFIPQ